MYFYNLLRKCCSFIYIKRTMKKNIYFIFYRIYITKDIKSILWWIRTCISLIVSTVRSKIPLRNWAQTELCSWLKTYNSATYSFLHLMYVHNLETLIIVSPQASFSKINKVSLTKLPNMLPRSVSLICLPMYPWSVSASFLTWSFSLTYFPGMSLYFASLACLPTLTPHHITLACLPGL